MRAAAAGWKGLHRRNRVPVRSWSVLPTGIGRRHLRKPSQTGRALRDVGNALRSRTSVQFIGQVRAAIELWLAPQTPNRSDTAPPLCQIRTSLHNRAGRRRGRSHQGPRLASDSRFANNPGAVDQPHPAVRLEPPRFRLGATVGRWTSWRDLSANEEQTGAATRPLGIAG